MYKECIDDLYKECIDDFINQTNFGRWDVENFVSLFKKYPSDTEEIKKMMLDFYKNDDNIDSINTLFTRLTLIQYMHEEGHEIVNLVD